MNSRHLIKGVWRRDLGTPTSRWHPSLSTFYILVTTQHTSIFRLSWPELESTPASEICGILHRSHTTSLRSSLPSPLQLFTIWVCQLPTPNRSKQGHLPHVSGVDPLPTWRSTATPRIPPTSSVTPSHTGKVLFLPTFWPSTAGTALAKKHTIVWHSLDWLKRPRLLSQHHRSEPMWPGLSLQSLRQVPPSAIPPLLLQGAPLRPPYERGWVLNACFGVKTEV
jgi:hypothetical protein